MKKVAFIGSGELSLHIAHYMEEDKQFEVIGFFDDFKPIGSNVDTYKVIGKIEDVLNQYKEEIFDGLVIGIGYTRFDYRREMFERFKGSVPFLSFIHSTCIVDKTALIGEGTILFPRCILDKNVVIKENVFFHLGCIIAHDTIIENHSYFSPSVTVAGFSSIGESCNIGVGTIISDNVSIYKDCRTGAGTIVVKDILESGTYVGVPARKIRETSN